MDDLDRYLRVQIKKEADEQWFDGLSFDARLQEKVRESLRQPQRKRHAVMEWIRAARQSWRFGVTAAAIAALLVTSVSMGWLGSDHASPGQPGGTALPMSAATGTAPTAKTFEPGSTDEARNWFGFGFLAPTQLPDGFQLQRISGYPVEDGPASRIILTYVSDGKSFMVMEERTESLLGLNGYEKWELNGNDVYVKTVDGIAELIWLHNGIRYTITGQLTETEAANVAKSCR